MAENNITYLNRNFEDYQSALKEYIQKRYPQIANDLDDASIGSWLIDVVASVADNLSYHIDRVYGETNINSAQLPTSMYALARNNGFKIPGPKASIAEVVFSCILTGVTENGDTSGIAVPDWDFAPKIKKGTMLTYRNQSFEVMSDIDFNEQFNIEGVSNRNIMPNRNANGAITSYTITKTDVVYGGESKVYRQVVDSVYPFMEIVLPDSNITEVESVLFKIGNDYQSNPQLNEFMMNSEYQSGDTETYRYFEVNSLMEQYRWGDKINTNIAGNQANYPSEKYTFTYFDENKGIEVPCYSVTKGEWKPLTQKFITEYTDRGYLKLIFGGGESQGQEISNCEQTFSKWQMSRMIRNNFLGKLPPSDQCTMYVLYRVGGGIATNVPTGALTNISFLNVEIDRCNKSAQIASSVRNSIKVTNTTPSVCGKDAPTVDELRAMIKYNNSAQERCITLKDYENRIALLPPRYGSPFRTSVIEANNKIMIYMLGLDYLGKLTSEIPVTMIQNVQNYISLYRSINDFVEIKSGKVVNLSFDISMFVDKNYNYGDVMKNVISVITDYMDINKHYIGEDIFVGDLEKEISNVDGVINLIDMRIYNEFGTDYSNTRIDQEIKAVTEEPDPNYGTVNDENSSLQRAEVDLDVSDYILNSNADTMFEIKYPEKDIRIMMKTR